MSRTGYDLEKSDACMRSKEEYFVAEIRRMILLVLYWMLKVKQDIVRYLISSWDAEYLIVDSGV